ncbi:MAG: hypothetical protein KC731_04320, partial [Myxococcales bacterium]|nr:hypothetical protein [Myxococcales bacterium]
DGRTARVVSPPTPRVDFGRPLVRLLDGGGYLDLNEVGEGGPAVAEIVATLDQDYVASPPSDEAPLSEDPSEWAERLSSLPPEDDGLEWSLDDEEEPPVDDDVYVMVGPKDEPRSELPSIPPPPDPEPAPRPMARPPVSDRPPPSNPGLETPLVPQQGLRPAAQGTFAKSPLPHLLVYALDNALTGSMLIVDRHRQRHAIRFEAGQPSKVHTALVVAPLDRVVAEMDLVPRDVLDRTLARATRDHSLHGQILVKRGLLQLDELLAVLRQQIVDRMGFLMRLGPTTRYAYYDGVDLLADMGGAITSPCDPYPLIMMGVRKYLDWDVLDKVLEKVKDRELTLHPEATPARLGLKREEREALEFFEREPMSLIELLGFGDLDEVAAQRLIYALIVTRSIDLSKGTRRPVGV